MKTRVFDMVADRLIVLQLASLLEVAHVLLGWVKGAVLPAIIQVTFVIWVYSIPGYYSRAPFVVNSPSVAAKGRVRIRHTGFNMFNIPMVFVTLFRKLR